MAMYDELVKKLRYCGNAVSCLHCPYWVGCGGSKEDLMRAADAIEELSKRVPPIPHGRLIDADAMVADLKRQCKEVFKTDAVSPDDFWITRDQAYNERLWTTWCESLYDYINAAPTIIEAEPPKEE